MIKKCSCQNSSGFVRIDITTICLKLKTWNMVDNSVWHSYYFCSPFVTPLLYFTLHQPIELTASNLIFLASEAVQKTHLLNSAQFLKTRNLSTNIFCLDGVICDSVAPHMWNSCRVEFLSGMPENHNDCGRWNFTAATISLRRFLWWKISLMIWTLDAGW